MMNLLTESSGAAGGGIALMLIYIVIIGAAMYFFAIRPQKKEQKRMNAMLSALEIGDTVVTTSGFYGVVIDITDEDCIVEFGSNKNCRIPMKKRARHKKAQKNKPTAVLKQCVGFFCIRSEADKRLKEKI